MFLMYVLCKVGNFNNVRKELKDLKELGFDPDVFL